MMTLHHEVTFHRGDAIAEMKFRKRLAFCENGPTCIGPFDTSPLHIFKRLRHRPPALEAGWSCPTPSQKVGWCFGLKADNAWAFAFVARALYTVLMCYLFLCPIASTLANMASDFVANGSRLKSWQRVYAHVALEGFIFFAHEALRLHQGSIHYTHWNFFTSCKEGSLVAIHVWSTRHGDVKQFSAPGASNTSSCVTWCYLCFLLKVVGLALTPLLQDVCHLTSLWLV